MSYRAAAEEKRAPPTCCPDAVGGAMVETPDGFLCVWCEALRPLVEWSPPRGIYSCTDCGGKGCNRCDPTKHPCARCDDTREMGLDALSRAAASARARGLR